jgi:putative membrane protein
MITYDSKAWLAVLVRVRGSVLPRLVGRTIVCTILGGLAMILHDEKQFFVPPIAHTLIGVALGLLLVFRTNASYDRYWEGRRLVGQMVNRSRDLARQIATLVTGDGDDVARDRATMRRHVAAFFSLTRQALRMERDLGALGDRLTADERTVLEPIGARATAVLSWVSARLVAQVEAGRLTEQRLLACDASVTALVDALGGCERILKTPMPFAYAQHIKTLVFLFCFTAPFVMVDAMRWLTPVGAGLLAFALFGIDEIGVEIEDPFGYDANDLPLDDIDRFLDGETTEILASAR